MKFLVDENLSKSDKFLSEHPNFVNVKHMMKEGENDDKIIQRAKSEGFGLVTKDDKLALRALVAGIKVWYFDAQRNTDHKLECKEFQEESVE